MNLDVMSKSFQIFTTFKFFNSIYISFNSLKHLSIES